MSQLVETTFLTAKEIKDGEEQAKSACVVVLNPNGDGSILAITKQKEFGNIGLPGGRIDKDLGENARAAAVRECLEETGILVEKSSLIPLHWGMGRTMISFTYLVQKVVGGKLHCMTREGLPMWVNAQALLRDDCSYKQYNILIITKLLEHGIPIGT